MKNKLSKIITHPFFSGSLIMVLGTNGANAINYIYHMIMGRILGPSDYGVLAALISLITILSILPQSFSLVIVKFVSSASNKENIKSLYKFLNKKIYLLSLGLSLIILIFSNYISKFLNIRDVFVYLVAISFFFFIPAAFYRSILQGMLKFGNLVISIFSDTLIKLTLGLMLVLMGLQVLGAMLGLVLAILTGWGLAYYFIKDIRKIEKPSRLVKMRPIILYSVPVFLQFITLTSFYSSDVLLVKHFFNSFDAGIYAAVSSLGKIIFFAAAPVTSVMFPIISMKNSKNEKFIKFFLLTILITIGMSLVVLTIYYLFPVFAISLSFGKAFVNGTTILFPYALFITILSLTWVIINFNLSLGKTRTVFIPCVGAILQIILILYFHQTLMEVVFISLIVSFIMLLALSLSTIFQLKK